MSWSINNFKQGFPNPQQPFVDPETGKINDPWMRLLIALWNRVGSGPGYNARDYGYLSMLTLDDDFHVQVSLDSWAVDQPDSGVVPVDPLQSWMLDVECDQPQVDPLLPLLLNDDADPTPFPFPPIGKVSGCSYPTWIGNVGASGVIAAGDTLYVYPFYLDEDIVLTSLFLRVVTGGSVGAAGKAGIWLNKDGRPVGLPLVFDNTGVAMTGTGIIAFSVASTKLHRGWYWAGCKVAAVTTRPVFTNIVGTSTLMAAQIGGTTTANALMNGATNQISAMSVASTYSNDLPDLTGASLVNVTGATQGIPVLGFTVG